jgi:hypothetical protein
MQEQALRTGTAADEQFTDFVEPADAVINITVESNIRMVGKFRLAAAIKELLEKEGYKNVAVNQSLDMFTSGAPFLNEDLLDAQKLVKIQLDVK